MKDNVKLWVQNKLNSNIIRGYYFQLGSKEHKTLIIKIDNQNYECPCIHLRENITVNPEYNDHGFLLTLPSTLCSTLPEEFLVEIHDKDGTFVGKRKITNVGLIKKNLKCDVEFDISKDQIQGYLLSKNNKEPRLCKLKIDDDEYELLCNESNENYSINFDLKDRGFVFKIPLAYFDNKSHVIRLYDKISKILTFEREIIFNQLSENNATSNDKTNTNAIKHLLSIVVPVYNVEKFINKCLTSILEQSFKDFEVILVNDGSTDTSGEICDHFAKLDNRFKVIHSKNSGTFNARRTGVLHSVGKYITFMDSDDYYTTQSSLESIIELIQCKNVDILQFHCEVISETSYPTEYTVKALNKNPVEIGGAKNIIQSCFIDSKFSYNLWNKIYNGQVVRKVANMLDECYMPSSQDAYLFFYIALYSKSYSLVETNPIYTYRIGNGLSTKPILPYERFCQVSDDYQIIVKHTNFLKANLIYEEYMNFIKEYEKKIIMYPCQILYRIDKNLMTEGFDLLCEKIPSRLLVRGLFPVFKNKIYDLACIANSSKVLKSRSKNKDIKRVAFYFPHYVQGGVERVISLQMPIFQKLGYKVFLITDFLDDDEYVLPEGVERIVVAPKYEENRADELHNVILEKSIDAIIYHALSSPRLMFDIVMFKLLGVKVVGLRHELTYQTFGVLDEKPANYHRIYQNLDKLVVLARTEEMYFNVMGCNTVYIPNIVQFSQQKKVNGDSCTILWLGRFHQNQKNYFDPVLIIAEVAKKIPNAKLVMLGREEEAGAYSKIYKFLKENNLEQNVIIAGSVSDVEKYYSKSYIHLMTSSYETFPMVMIESKSFGLPLVTYSMPYLELLREGGGYINVAQGDIKGAADAIVCLFEDKQLWNKLSLESYQSLDKFKKYNQAVSWKGVIDDISKDSLSSISKIENTFIFDKESMKIFLESSLFHYVKGCERYTELKKEYNAMSKYKKIKIDFINKGDIEKIEILSTLPAKIFKALTSPRWLPKGAIVESTDGQLEVALKVYGSGDINIKIGGPDFRSSSGKNIPIFISLNYLEINGEIIVDKPQVISWNDAYLVKFNVVNGSDINLKCEWSALN